VVLQFPSYTNERLRLEHLGLKFRFSLLGGCYDRQVALKLKLHRLKPGGVSQNPVAVLALKLKLHRLKPGGVSQNPVAVLALKLKLHRLKPVVSEAANLCFFASI
jgi:hypothetical protein